VTLIHGITSLAQCCTTGAWTQFAVLEAVGSLLCRQSGSKICGEMCLNMERAKEWTLTAR